jgi:hypothetical protein
MTITFFAGIAEGVAIGWREIDSDKFAIKMIFGTWLRYFVEMHATPKTLGFIFSNWRH